jgi:hypothetical protein
MRTARWLSPRDSPGFGHPRPIETRSGAIWAGRENRAAPSRGGRRARTRDPDGGPSGALVPKWDGCVFDDDPGHHAVRWGRDLPHVPSRRAHDRDRANRAAGAFCPGLRARSAPDAPGCAGRHPPRSRGSRATPDERLKRAVWRRGAAAASSRFVEPRLPATARSDARRRTDIGGPRGIRACAGPGLPAPE